MFVPMLWAFVNSAFYATGRGLGLPKAFGLAALSVSVTLIFLAVSLWWLLPMVKPALQPRLGLLSQVLCFAVAGVVRASVMVAVVPTRGLWLEEFAWLSVSWAINAVVWMVTVAVLVNWWHQARDRQLLLEAEYERQIRTRKADALALAEADLSLAEVRASTHQALDSIQLLLNPRMGAKELTDCVDLIDKVVADLVRPTSHDLAEMAEQVVPTFAQPLRRGWREILPALVRSWPRARPFHPGLVALLCIPMVVAAEMVWPPHRVDATSLVPLGVLGLQVALLAIAEVNLAPRMARMPARSAVAVASGSYLLLYIIGFEAFNLTTQYGKPGPIEAFFMPALVAMLGGLTAAFVSLSRSERDAAQALIRHTNWGVRHTKQRLWAQRRRLATALHGRVQANLTAASLMLRMARDQLSAGGVLNQETVQRVRETLAMAALIDQPPTGSPKRRLDMVVSVWEGVLAIDLELRPDGLALLDADMDLTDACVEVLREILLNSVRHSGSTSAEVVIGAVSPALLCLRVIELGAARRPAGAPSGPGLGRSLIDSLAVDWAEHADDDGRVTVSLLTGAASSSRPVNAHHLLFDVSGLT